MGAEGNRGYAFILEGDTEREFYYAFLQYLCGKYGASISKVFDAAAPDISYILQIGEELSPIKFKTVNAITQIPRTGNWFNTQCVGKNGPDIEWYVFLCYDRDDYKEDISKFYQGDWANLRKSLKKANRVIDVAAAADIEDVMLQDINHVCEFVGCSQPVALRGRKGKIKLKNLFSENGKFYHEGKRAKPLIEALDMEVLIRGNIVPLAELERIMFK